MTLAVRVEALRVASWGWTVAGGWDSPLNRRLGVAEGDGTFLRWDLDPDALTGSDQRGHRIALRPFMGVMGMPPDEPGLHSTAPPRFCGGNLDCKELVADSTLYLPIPVDGALFSVGDGHAVQGDGELATTALECPMDLVELGFDLVPNLSLAMPRADTPIGWLTFGIHEDLDEAAHLAIDGMLRLLGELHGLPRGEALALASLLVDVRVTQICNGVMGVHAVLPRGAMG
jgi:acetamidase/formamidase